MSVNFAAVHDRNPWRRHRIHQSLVAAIDGNDGAKKLLLKRGRVAGMWAKYGNVRGVFVWEDDAEIGFAFRLNSAGGIDSVNPSIDRILAFNAAKGCTPSQIAELFAVASPASTLPVSVADPTAALGLWPDDLPEGHYVEGLAKQVLVNRYERSLGARAASIAHYGCICQVCLIDFSKRYGVLGEGFIHVHHLQPLSDVDSEYRIDPVADLLPVCPNCHAMLHRHDPPLTPERLRGLLRDG